MVKKQNSRTRADQLKTDGRKHLTKPFTYDHSSENGRCTFRLFQDGHDLFSLEINEAYLHQAIRDLLFQREFWDTLEDSPLLEKTRKFEELLEMFESGQLKQDQEKLALLMSLIDKTEFVITKAVVYATKLLFQKTAASLPQVQEQAMIQAFRERASNENAGDKTDRAIRTLAKNRSDRFAEFEAKAVRYLAGMPLELRGGAHNQKHNWTAEDTTTLKQRLAEERKTKELNKLWTWVIRFAEKVKFDQTRFSQIQEQEEFKRLANGRPIPEELLNQVLTLKDYRLPKAKVNKPRSLSRAGFVHRHLAYLIRPDAGVIAYNTIQEYLKHRP